MKQEIQDIKEDALAKIAQAKTEKECEALRIEFLGKKSAFNQILRSLSDLSAAEKKEVGPLANNAKKAITEALERRTQECADAFNAEREWIDVTAPGHKHPHGHIHPLSRVQNDIEDIFSRMGFEIADGPEVETEFYNFDAVNIPADHPGRDMQDTFWVNKAADRKEGAGIVLRTHTSNVQVRYMEKHEPPFRIIIPGRVFRNEATDASHEHTFHQFEALVVGDDISAANFRFIAQEFFSQFFGKDLSVRLRPSYFPFVEPGFEFDISCVNCDGKGCSVCQRTGWVEVGGAGMVHQNVFEAAGYKRNQFQGFAWGFGLERLAMMKYKIDDIRHFHSGDIRVAEQF